MHPSFLPLAAAAALAPELEFASSLVVPTFDPALFVANDPFGGRTFLSRDGGETVTEVRRGLSSLVFDLTPSSNEVDAGTRADGVHRLQD